MTHDLSALKGLEKRLAEATGPDRELDAALWWHLIADKNIMESDLRRKFEHNPARGCDFYFSLHAWRNRREVPHYTTSLDAAIALCERMLPGAEWEMSTLHGEAWVELPLNGSPASTHRKDSQVALAFCTTIVRALIQAENA